MERINKNDDASENSFGLRQALSYLLVLGIAFGVPALKKVMSSTRDRISKVMKCPRQCR